jgi:hypothetical protein
VLTGVVRGGADRSGAIRGSSGDGFANGTKAVSAAHVAADRAEANVEAGVASPSMHASSSMHASPSVHSLGSDTEAESENDDDTDDDTDDDAMPTYVESVWSHPSGTEINTGIGTSAGNSASTTGASHSGAAGRAAATASRCGEGDDVARTVSCIVDAQERVRNKSWNVLWDGIADAVARCGGAAGLLPRGVELTTERRFATATCSGSHTYPHSHTCSYVRMYPHSHTLTCTLVLSLFPRVIGRHQVEVVRHHSLS